jgi:hypothetical protein
MILLCWDGDRSIRRGLNKPAPMIKMLWLGELAVGLSVH